MIMIAAQRKIAIIALKAAFCTIFSNTVHHCFRHLPRYKHTPFMVVIRLFREIGWFHGMIDHGGYNFFRRFDLNGGRMGNTLIKEERKIRLEKMVFSVLCSLWIHIDGGRKKSSFYIKNSPWAYLSGFILSSEFNITKIQNYLAIASMAHNLTIARIFLHVRIQV
jgi:hypothetical protein